MSSCTSSLLVPLALRLEVLRNQLFLQLRQRLRIMAELHTELALSLRRRPQIATESKHSVQTEHKWFTH